MSNAQKDSQGWYYIIADNYSDVLSDAEKKHNALKFYSYFKSKMTLAAIAGILGNIERESLLNPGQIEADSSYNEGWDEKRKGHGFIQWTGVKNGENPLLDWVGKPSKKPYDTLDWFNGALQCYRIECEGKRKEGVSGEWLNGSTYSYTWDEFCKLTDYEIATKAYLEQRERAGVDALTERLANAKKWYNFLEKNAWVFIEDTSAFDTSYTYGIHKGKITEENKNFKLTDHLTLGLFKDSGSSTYAYSDSTVGLLEKLILTYKDTINQKNPIHINSSYRSSYTDMHGIGGAIDVKFKNNAGDWIDCRYIAVAAEKIGFSGIAPLHANGFSNPAYVIHMDTRGDYVAAGGKYNNKSWRGLEFPDVNKGNGWYDSTTITGSLQSYYNISNDDLTEVLGQAYTVSIDVPDTDFDADEIVVIPPEVTSLVVTDISTTSAVGSVYISGDELSALYYTINNSIINLPINTGTITFNIENLTPNTAYTITVTATNAGGTSTSIPVIFTTEQDYPDSIQSMSIVSQNKNLETTAFNITVNGPDSWGYWYDKGNAAGYRVFIISNYLLKYYFDDTSASNSFSIIPSTYGIGHGENFQVGISVWVTDDANNKIFAQPGEEYPICSNSICLKDKSEMSDIWYSLINGSICKAQPYIKTNLFGNFKPLNIFKL